MYCTNLANHVWELKERNKRSPNINCRIFKKNKCDNTSGNSCKLCPEEKLVIVTDPNRKNCYISDLR